MAASIFGGGTAPNVNVTGSFVSQSFTATDGQVLFTLSAFTYTQGTNSLLVFINGQRQVLSRDYTETSTSSLTLTEGALAGDYVDVIGMPAVQVSTVPLGNTGTAVFAAATTKAVVFDTVQADALYKVFLGPQANKTFWVTNKTTAGFTLNASSASSDSVDWAIGR